MTPATPSITHRRGLGHHRHYVSRCVFICNEGELSRTSVILVCGHPFIRKWLQDEARGVQCLESKQVSPPFPKCVLPPPRRLMGGRVLPSGSDYLGLAMAQRRSSKNRLKHLHVVGDRGWIVVAVLRGYMPLIIPIPQPAPNITRRVDYDLQSLPYLIPKTQRCSSDSAVQR